MPAHGFDLLRQEHIGEINTQASFFKHRTGAELLSLANDDENKVFGVTFRTPPSDSTGIAHILEHAVLCGSRKYPVKEPFVELLKGSLNTFLNAFTYPDKTCYPVASQNLQDFYNLIDVYLDAVFHPRITPQVLQQEGWHYELEQADEPLAYKGVVFNEMKGAYSSPESVLGRLCQESLFPDNTYGVDSGGDPRHIPELTFEQFADFHRRFYHPANARIFFYGNDDFERRLELLEEYLSEFEPLAVDSAIAAQPPFTSPRRLVEPYSVSEDGEEADKCMVVINWLLQDELDAETHRALRVLEYVLVNTSASPLRKALIDSGLGEDLVNTGLETELKQLYFSVGLKGVEADQVDAVEQLIFSTLERLAATGFDQGMIDAAINSTEFRLRENNTGSYPRGLMLMLRSLTNWLYDRDPLAPLAFSGPLDVVKEGLARDEAYLNRLIGPHLLNNEHRTAVVLEPDPTLAERLETEEKERLEAVRQGLDKADLEGLVESTQQLRQAQEQPDPPEVLARLPRLQLGDLERQISTVPLEVVQQGCDVLYHDLFTNGIVYLDVGFDLHTLSQDDLPYLSLFSRALLEMGTEKEDFVKLSQRIGAQTGGIWPQPLVTSQRGNNRAAAWVFLRGKAMAGQVGALLDILRDILLTVRFDDRERFVQMLLEEKAGEEAGLVPSGHRAVNLRLRASFEEASWINEQIGGVNYLFFLRRLVEEVERDWSAVVAKLEDMRRRLITRQAMICNATLAAADRADFAVQLDGLLEAIPDVPFEPAVWTPTYLEHDEGLAVPAQINYVGKGGSLYDLGYTMHGSAAVVCRYVSTTWLWDRIRVQGGAYGAFCSFDHFSGVLSYTSYRDPNLSESLDIYDQTGHFLRTLDINEDELTKAIIGTIGDLDGYQLPDAKGYTSMVRHLIGVDDSFRQLRRDEVLGSTAADFINLAAAMDKLKERGRVVAMGSQETLDAANRQRPGWLEVVKVL